MIHIFRNQSMMKKWQIIVKNRDHGWDQNNDEHEKKIDYGF